MTKDIHKLRARIFIDANVLIGSFRGINKDVQAIEYLRKLPQVRLFTSSLAIAQLMATCQLKGDNERRQLLIKYINAILKDFSVISCSATDIEKAMSLEQPDMEDNLQYIMGERMKCTHYVTNNKRDFIFANVTVIPSAKIRLVGA